MSELKHYVNVETDKHVQARQLTEPLTVTTEGEHREWPAGSYEVHEGGQARMISQQDFELDYELLEETGSAA